MFIAEKKDTEYYYEQEDFVTWLEENDLLDEATFSDLEYINEGLDHEIEDTAFTIRRDKMRKEIDKINNELGRDKIEVGKLKGFWNRVVAYIFTLIESMGFGAAAGTVIGTIAAAPVKNKNPNAVGTIAAMFVISVAIGILSRIISKMFYSKARRKDLLVMKKDIEEIIRRLEEKKRQDPKNKKKYDTNIERLEKMLDMINREESQIID